MMRTRLAGSTSDLAVIHFFCWAELAVSSSRDTYGQSSLDAPRGNTERWHQPTHSKRAAVVQGYAERSNDHRKPIDGDAPTCVFSLPPPRVHPCARTSIAVQRNRQSVGWKVM